MRIHQRTSIAAAAALIGSFALLGTGAGTATATATADETSVALPSSSFRDIVVDGLHDHVFVSDPDGGTVVVTGYDGSVVRQITAEEGAAGLALSKDSSKLYVALSTADAIAEIDTATLTETHRYPTGAGTKPETLALAGGKLWFGYAADSQGGIGSVDVASTAPTATLVASGRSWYYAPSLESSPADPNVLVAGQEGTSPASMAVYDTAAGDLQKRVESSFISSPSISFLNDFAVTADGQNIVLAANNPSDHQVVRLSDLTSNGSYSSWQFPNAVAVASDGTVATGAEGDFVKTYRPGTTWPAYREYGVNDLQRDGLAWAPDENRLFAVTGVFQGSAPTLHVLPDAGKLDTTLSLTAPTTSRKGRDLTVTGQLWAGGEAFPAGTSVDVTRTDAEHPEGVAVGTFPVDTTTFNFTFTEQPRAAGDITYTATYKGDGAHLPSTNRATVTITK
ncbi:YncE family protein [Streptomyces sp. NPDC050085]|uniref:YncE family protein n=1 Tax=Streptomyces sp. NPDC050085 TaxID=3365600 RepID=UPI0037BADC50